MNYRVLLKESEEGWAVWVPSLPGCASQGATQEEAMENIRVAIEEYLEVANELRSGEADVIERTVSVPASLA